MEVEEKIETAQETKESVIDTNSSQDTVDSFESPDDMMDRVLGKGKYEQREEVEGAEEVVEEGQEEEVEAVEANEERAQELLAKGEKEGLTDEEANELKEMGYVEEEGEVETDTEGKKEEDIEVKEEEEDVWEAPSYVDQLRELYPESQLGSESEVSDAIYSMISDMKVNNEANQQLEEALKKDPEFAEFTKAVVVDGKSVAEAAMEAGIDLSDSIPEPGDDGYKEYIIAQEKKKEVAQRANEFKQTRQTNLNRSITEVQRYFSENKIDPKDAKVIGERLDKVFDDIYNGKISSDFIKLIHDGITAPEKIKTAETVAHIKGKNEQMKIKKRTFRKGDGMNKLAGKKSSIKSQGVTYADDGSEYVYKMMGEG